MPSIMSPYRILETTLCCPDLAAAESFYVGILGLQKVAAMQGRHLFLRCGDGMFLLFNPAATELPSPPGVGIPVPPHGWRGSGHAAFAMRESEIESWRNHLTEHGVEIEMEFTWPTGGHSIYFRDPAGNSLELATPKLWGMAE